MLQRLKREGDMATQLANPGTLNDRIEEIQREVYSSQQQLHASEERLRMFEPGPATFGSTTEIDDCEKLLVDVLARVIQRKNYLLGDHMNPFDPIPSGVEGANGAEVYVKQEESLGGLAGDAALWAAAEVESDAGHQMFGASDPFIYLRDQDVYDATSQVAVLHGGDPCAAGVDAGGEVEVDAEAEAWRQAYTCTELLSTLIPATPFPLTPHCLGLDEQFIPLQDGGMAAAQEQVEASASCSYVPSDDAGTPAMANDGTAAPGNVA
nr:unnamed protein product [Digitaria exilis]